MPKKLGEILRSRRALIVYLTVGDPLVWNGKIIGALASSTDIFELGIPTKRPKYDGPAVRASYKRALQSGLDERSAILLAGKKGLRDSIVFTYFDVALAYGVEDFMKCAADAARCVLFPDLLIDYPENLGSYLKLCEKYGLEHAFFITSSFPHALIVKLAKMEPSFIYLGLMASSGILLPISISRNIRIIKGLVGDIPLVVGFALRSPEQVALCINAGANGVVVGSAILKLLETKSDVRMLEDFISSLKSALGDDNGQSAEKVV
jgi:tryptophan synthase alpha chain